MSLAYLLLGLNQTFDIDEKSGWAGGGGGGGGGGTGKSVGDREGISSPIKFQNLEALKHYFQYFFFFSGDFSSEKAISHFIVYFFFLNP